MKGLNRGLLRNIFATTTINRLTVQQLGKLRARAYRIPANKTGKQYTWEEIKCVYLSLTAVDVEDGLHGVHDSHEGDHDAEYVDAGPGHVHHETVHHHRLARPESDLHCPLFSGRATAHMRSGLQRKPRPRRKTSAPQNDTRRGHDGAAHDLLAFKLI